MDSSGIFGYINYLVERDRKYILDTLLNGECDAGFEFWLFADRSVTCRPLEVGIPRLRLSGSGHRRQQEAGNLRLQRSRKGC